MECFSSEHLDFILDKVRQDRYWFFASKQKSDSDSWGYFQINAARHVIMQVVTSMTKYNRFNGILIAMPSIPLLHYYELIN